ncbi:ATP-dependent 6-phosphofructokinase [Klenkia sp. LSe6-5]|uniref:ATP-dependent 6-phosphofructokinase n=1 Tax=Klenkia sesuvii TaxID=3103137 RepID=A0ABU8DYK3_9ACTN
MDSDEQIQLTAADLAVRTLGELAYPSPLDGGLLERGESVHYVGEHDRVLVDGTLGMATRRGVPVEELPTFEPGGPRRRLFFDPKGTKVGIVTCGGLCPGLNNVIRGLVGELAEHYGVHSVLGFRDGYLGLTPDGDEPVELTPESVRWINQQGGTVLGTSRGGQDPKVMVETLRLRQIDILFVVGGDGSLRGAQAIADEATRQGLPIAVVGVPKTIDNDIPWIDRSFGFQTAFGRAAESIRAAATEARSHRGGVGLVKLMGRHSGFIAAYATLASDDVDLVLIPEVPMPLGGDRGVLAHVERVLAEQGHAVVVVAEGYGQDMFAGSEGGADASGNAKLFDIGKKLRDELSSHLNSSGIPFQLRYVDPGYAIRSVPANSHDSVYCTRLAQAAVHAAMAGRTATVAGRWHGRFVNLPIPLVTRSRNQVDPRGDLWLSVLEATGQPVHV